MKKQIKRKIYLLSKREMKPVEVIQYETGVQLVFEVQDIELDTTATATLFVRKPSGKFVFQEDNISLTSNTVVIDLHNQAITEHGHPFFQIKFKKDEEVISTYSGMLTVEKSLDDSGAEESKTVIAAFDEFTDEQIVRIEEATRSQIDLMKAEVEAKGETILATIPDEYTEMYNRVNTLFNSVANAIKGVVSGSVVKVDDVSPVEHCPTVWVHGKNLLNIPETVVEGNYPWCNTQIGSFELKPGTYTISADFLQQGADISKPAISARKYESVTVQYASTSSTEESGRLKLTFTIPADEKGFTLYAYSNVTANTLETSCIFSNFQIEKGSVATEYTPYIDATKVELTRCGKAIFSKSSQIVSGVEKPWASLLVAAVKVPPGDYVASCRFKQTGTDKSTVSMSVRTYNDYTVPFGDASSSEVEGNLLKQFTVTPGSGGFQIFLYSNTPNLALTTECSFENICVEVGSKATGYEVYKGTKHTPSSDGTVEGITSLSPVMTLLTDTEGVTIECEYNKDTGKVVEKLSNAVVALGGVV